MLCDDTDICKNNLTLWNNGEALINAATSVSNNVIVVVHSVGPVLMGNWLAIILPEHIVFTC